MRTLKRHYHRGSSFASLLSEITKLDDQGLASQESLAGWTPFSSALRREGSVTAHAELQGHDGFSTKGQISFWESSPFTNLFLINERLLIL
jgi:hypothetical protein